MVAAEVLAGEEAGTVGKGDVVNGEALVGAGVGGDEENTAGAEAEEKYGAMEVREMS